MKLNFARFLAATGVLAAAALGSAAHARDNINWSVGIDAAPGVSIGVGNVRPVYVAPAPVYVAPAPVYMAPRPVYVQPAPVVVAPAPVYYGGYYQERPRHKHGHKHHHRHHRHWD